MTAKTLSFRRLMDILTVVSPEKRPGLKAAIERGDLIILRGRTTEEKALLQKLKEYEVPHALLDASYNFSRLMGPR